MELLQSFVDQFLVPFAGNPHLGLFLVVWFSAVFPLAPPEEFFTLVGGAAVAAGILNWFGAAVAILGGIILTNISLYWMGRGGLKLLSGSGLGNRILHSKGFRKARQAMLDKGIWAIFGCRFFFGARTPTYLASGFFRFRFDRFLLIDVPTVLLHGIPFLFIGYLFHEQIDSVFDFFEVLGWWSLLFLVALIAGFIGVQRYLDQRRNRAA